MPLKQHDDYNKIMVKALADRLAEALRSISMSVCVSLLGLCAEREPQQRRADRENYQASSGTGYQPAEHTEKATIWELLEVEETHWHETQNLSPCGRCIGFRVGISATGQQVLRCSTNPARSG